MNRIKNIVTRPFISIATCNCLFLIVIGAVVLAGMLIAHCSGSCTR